MNPSFLRQGDVLLERVEEIPEYIRENKKNRRTDGVIVRGESGNVHRLAVKDAAAVFECGGSMFISVGLKGVSLIHEEHGPVVLEPNTVYHVHHAREYDYLSEVQRFVRD